MVTTVRGNILAADVEALVNPVNTVGVMGAGLALQFKRAYPTMFTVYQQACQAGTVRLGQMHLWEDPDQEGPRFIINFPTKYHWKSTSYIEDIEAGLVDMVRVIQQNQIRSVAIPALGCGYGGLAWSEVEPLIMAALEPLEDDVNIMIYPPAPTATGIR